MFVFSDCTIHFILFSIFLMWTIFKGYIELAAVLLLLRDFWSFGYKTCRTPSPQPGLEPTPPESEGEISAAGAPGKSLNMIKSSLLGIYRQILPSLSSELENTKST